MTYDDALLWVHSAPRFAPNPRLGRFRRLLEEIGNPEKGLKFFHVAGTNGKGSVSATIASILAAGGLKTGLYTSPELEDFRERIAINSKMISKTDVVRHATTLYRAYKSLEQQGLELPIQFELITALALMHFAHERCDAVVLETGLGGQYDATNVVLPLVSVITTIGLDHVDILGVTMANIAFEKAGIIKDGVPIVSGANDPEADRVIAEMALSHNADLIRVGPGADVRWNEILSGIDGQVLDISGPGFSHKSVRLPLLGRHQMQNASVAVAAVETVRQRGGLEIDDSAIKAGLNAVVWPGRLEVFKGAPTVVLDAAHNPQGAQALVATLRQFGEKRIIAVVGVLNDRLHSEVAYILADVASDIIVTTPQGSRALKASVLAKEVGQKVKVIAIDDIGLAFEHALTLAGPDDVVVVCGSFHLIGPVRSLLRAKRGEDDRLLFLRVGTPR